MARSDAQPFTVADTQRTTHHCPLQDVSEALPAVLPPPPPPVVWHESTKWEPATIFAGRGGPVVRDRRNALLLLGEQGTQLEQYGMPNAIMDYGCTTLMAVELCPYPESSASYHSFPEYSV